jgi:uncharacterized membrane protein
MRYPSIDILRTLAIFVMVLVHFGENLSGYRLPCAGFGAPLFAFLSGVSYRLWVTGQQSRGISELDISKVSVRRGLFVFGVGIAFNVLVWMPEDTFNWDVLTFVGTALLLLNLARRIPQTISVLFAVLAILVSPILRSLADYGAYWENGYFEYDVTLSDVWIGFLSVGYFPIFPWIAYSLAGFATASRLFVEPTEPSEPRPSPWPTIFTGAAFSSTAILVLGARSYLPVLWSQTLLGGWSMYPPTTVYVLGTLGLTLMLIGVVHHCVDFNPRALRYGGLLSIAKTFSRYSLTIYVLHHVIHLWPLWIYGVATGHEPTEYWTQAMPISISMPLALLFLAGCYELLRRLGPDRNYGIESWMRWVCD